MIYSHKEFSISCTLRPKYYILSRFRDTATQILNLKY